MAIYETDTRNGRETTPHSGQSRQLRAAVVSADEGLRVVVFEAIQDAGLPITLDVEIREPSRQLGPDQLERLRTADPDLLILDMSDDPERGIWAAGAITSGNPRIAVVGVGPELEASVLLNAMRAGIMEYAPRPVASEGMRDALERVMRKRGWGDALEGQRKGKLLAFFSPKGGSGSTSVITNVGIELHRLTGRKTLLVDLDLELGEIASLLGVRPRFHFVDLVRNFHRMDADLLASYIERHESGVHVLSAPFEPEFGEDVTGEQIARILGFLRKHYDYVLVDTSKSLAPPAIAALQIADSIFLVTNMDVPSLRNLKRCLPVLDRVTAGDADRLRLVVNRFNPKSLVRLEDLEETLGIDVFWTLTNDYQTVIHAISVGEPLVLKGGSRYAAELKGLARNIVDGPRGSETKKGSLLGRLFSSKRSSPSRARVPLKSEPVEAPNHG